jgi:hypothetical protein
VVLRWDKDCKEIFLLPYAISEIDVFSTIRNADHCQRATYEEFELILCMKKFDLNYLIVKGKTIRKDIVIKEVYKVYEDLIKGRNNSGLNLLSILAEFYQIIGSDFDFGGVKSKFLIDFPNIGVPKVPNGDIEIMIKDFLTISQFSTLQGGKTMFEILLNIRQGNYVDFIHVLLMYVFNPMKYGEYLEKNRSRHR